MLWFWGANLERHILKPIMLTSFLNRFLPPLWLFPPSPNKSSFSQSFCTHTHTYTHTHTHTHTPHKDSVLNLDFFFPINTGRGNIMEKPLIGRTMMLTFGRQCMFTQVQRALVPFINSPCFLPLKLYIKFQLVSKMGIF